MVACNRINEELWWTINHCVDRGHVVGTTATLCGEKRQRDVALLYNNLKPQIGRHFFIRSSLSTKRYFFVAVLQQSMGVRNVYATWY